MHGGRVIFPRHPQDADLVACLYQFQPDFPGVRIAPSQDVNGHGGEIAAAQEGLDPDSRGKSDGHRSGFLVGGIHHGRDHDAMMTDPVAGGHRRLPFRLLTVHHGIPPAEEGAGA